MSRNCFAKQLRKNMTDAERRLWYYLRAHRLQGFKFKRQQPIGLYIVDFVCLDAKLIIEVDGGQHTAAIDETRTNWLRSQGFRIMRFWNNEVFQSIDTVLQTIIDAFAPSPLPSTTRREGENHESE